MRNDESEVRNDESEVRNDKPEAHHPLAFRITIDNEDTNERYNESGNHWQLL